MPPTLRDLLANPPPLHQDGAGDLVSWGLLPDVLHFIDKRVDGDATTLETGAGLSTILFALKGCAHTCITPDAAEVARITAYCRAHDIDTARLIFHTAGSEVTLPRLILPPLDLVLIDGRHAFPTPFIDWYYTAERLVIGGLLIIDDTQVWTGRVLADFLAAEPEWSPVAEFPPRATIFRKCREGSHQKEWDAQPYLAGQERLDLARLATLERVYGETVDYARHLEATLADTGALARLVARRLLGRRRRRT